ncbi:hypothetical protein GCM10011392_25680 [Wenxinia marina]|nr:hypothetical protein GCM10011392_25680 [Wenxinia marina]
MTLPGGTFTGLLGPNGAGNSTLFRVVSGRFAPDAGEVRLFGQDHRAAGPAIRARLGVVFQSRSVDPDRSVRANLRRLHGPGGWSGGRPARGPRAGRGRRTEACRDRRRLPGRGPPMT